jgi:GNAT superfamily N-acetyltransferase
VLRVTQPEPILPKHDIESFDSGVPSLDDWLRKRARHNELEGASRTFVVCAGESPVVIGYYALAVGSVALTSAPRNVRRNMPDPIPVMILGRLAVDRRYQGNGLGQGLLRDAVLRTLQASQYAGIRALLVHAISDEVRAFYEKADFQQSPVNPNMLMLHLGIARKSIGT